MIMFNDSVIKGETLEGFSEVQSSISTITDKLSYYDKQLNMNKRLNNRRNWTNPRRYKTAGKSRKA